MIVILLYCVVCYLVMFGILLNEHNTLEEWTKTAIASFFLAPVSLPIFIGIHISENSQDPDSWQD